MRVASNTYADFWQVTRDALAFALASPGATLTPDIVDDLMRGFLRLPVWPDVGQTLAALKRSRIKTAILSNFNPDMLMANVNRAGLGPAFDAVLSTDAARTYKPDPRAYRLGTAAFGCAPTDVLFVASAGWDVAGARQFGYPTHWVNRPGAAAEELGAPADSTSRSLSGLLDVVP